MGYVIFVIILIVGQLVFTYLTQQGVVEWQDAIKYYPVAFIIVYLLFFVFWGRKFHQKFQNKNNFNSSPWQRLKNLRTSFEESKNLGASDEKATKDAAKKFFQDSFGAAFQGNASFEQQLKSPDKIREMISPLANQTTIQSNLQQIEKIKKVKKSKDIPNSYDLVGVFPDGSQHNFRATFNSENPPKITSLERIS